MSVTAPTGDIEVCGIRVTFVPIDSFGVRDGYEAWLIESAYRALWARKRFIKSNDNPDGFMTQSDWNDEHDATRRDVDAYVYSWGTETWGKSYASLPGLKKLLSLMILVANARQDAESFVEALYDPRRTMPTTRDEIVAKMLGWGQDPNSDGAETLSAVDTSAPTK